MYLLSVFFPLLGGLINTTPLARYLGHRGSCIVAITCMIIAFLSSVVIYYEVVFMGCAVSIDVFGTWFSVGTFGASWTFNFDILTANMLFTVTGVSMAVHMYACDYMRQDPHLSLFLGYLSFFTGFMCVLVAADNLLVMLVGWEGIGVCSYLLIGYWSHRLSAVKSAQKAILVNRISDGLLMWGVLWVWYHLGSLEYDLLNIYSASGFVGLSILIGAMGKSAQILFHVWLASAMEGSLKIKQTWGLCTDISAAIVESWKTSFLTSKQSDRQHFLTQVTTGLLLGDGHLRNPNCARRETGNFRLEFTFKAPVFEFVKWLKFVVLEEISTSTLPTPYPINNPTQYWFATRNSKFFTELANIWYVVIDGKRVKIVPNNEYLEAYLTDVALAHWIMGDGYWNKKAKRIVICTECFSKEEVTRLSVILQRKFGIVAVLQPRWSNDKTTVNYRLRFSGKQENLAKVRTLVAPYMHPLMLYKLGL
jgi:hypothetical protein